MAKILEQRQSLHRNLADREQLNDQLATQIEQLQVMANLGTVSAMIAHEMNNILTPLSNYAQLAIDNPEDEELTQKALRKTVANSQRATKILETMLAMANGQPQATTKHRLTDLIDEVFVCIARDFSRDKIRVDIQIPKDLTIQAQGLCLQQVLMNLILNAREAMLPDGGILKISAGKLPKSIEIIIADTGCGIEYENVEKIFEPFYTTKTKSSKSARSGIGLGLAFCKKVVDAHNGTISVESKASGGTTFKIILPK